MTAKAARGLVLDWKKESSLISWAIRKSNSPAKVRIFSNTSRPSVEVGDTVKVGQIIAEPHRSDSVFIHASISGKISAIGKFRHPLGEEAEAIEIESDKKDEKMAGLGEERKNWEELEPEELKKIFLESGLVSMKDAMIPLHVKASPKKKIKTLILNGCESEPYVTSTHSLMMSHPIEILKGADLFRKALFAENILFVTEENQLEAAELLKSRIFFLKWKHISTEVLPAIYPQDNETLLRRRFSDFGSLEILDVASAYAVWEAVARNKPFYERTITVGGECVIEPKNFCARIGTEFETLFKNAKGLLRPPQRVILGGPMRGYSQQFLDGSILPNSEALLGLPPEVIGSGEEEPCIRCGRCVEVCPSEISPVMITLAAERNLWDIARDYEVDRCIECGNCGYVCPSKRPMLELLRRAKVNLKTKL